MIKNSKLKRNIKIIKYTKITSSITMYNNYRTHTHTCNSCLMCPTSGAVIRPSFCPLARFLKALCIHHIIQIPHMWLVQASSKAGHWWHITQVADAPVIVGYLVQSVPALLVKCIRHCCARVGQTRQDVSAALDRRIKMLNSRYADASRCLFCFVLSIFFF